MAIPTPVVKPTKISRSKAVEIINNSKGRVMRIGYIKKDGTKRIMVCNRKKDATTKLGYLVVNDFQNKEIKNVDPRTMFSLRAARVEYVVK